jgi:hypothetical protein
MDGLQKPKIIFFPFSSFLFLSFSFSFATEERELQLLALVSIGGREKGKGRRGGARDPIIHHSTGFPSPGGEEPTTTTTDDSDQLTSREGKIPSRIAPIGTLAAAAAATPKGPR